MATPIGYSGASAIAMIQACTSEYTFPTQSTILTFLNKGLEEVVRRTGGIRLWAPYYTVTNQTTITLNDDVVDVISANFSMGNASSQNSGNSSPFAQGALVYPMVQLEQATFMDAAAGFPAVGFGPPQAFFVYQDQGSNPTTALPAPAAPVLSTVSGLGTSTVTPMFVQLTYTNPYGETTPSLQTQISLISSERVQVSSPMSIANANGYMVYVSTTPAGTESTFFCQTVSGPLTPTPQPLGTPFTILGTPWSSGSNPPLSNTATGAGAGGALSMQLYPAAMPGQVNIYYKARPQLFADTTSSSWTNLDTSAQEAAVLFAIMRVLYNRQRSAEANQIWSPQYESMIKSLESTNNRRTQPKSGQVRDVSGGSFPNASWWMTS